MFENKKFAQYLVGCSFVLGIIGAYLAFGAEGVGVVLILVASIGVVTVARAIDKYHTAERTLRLRRRRGRPTLDDLRKENESEGCQRRNCERNK